MGGEDSDTARKMALAGAKMAEQAERYDEMVASMKEIIDLGLMADDLTQEERNLISVITDVVKKYTTGPMKAQNPENLVFFYKMQGDYNRYGAEISEGDKKTMYKQKAEEAYIAATEAGEKGVDPKTGEPLKKTNPILLGLALNHSVFYFEICEERSKAKDLAQSAFDDALAKLDELPEEQYKDSTLIMQLLKDNLLLWSENDEDANIEVEDLA